MLLQKIRLLLTALWLGNLATVGYMVAPSLFATLADRALAGTIAGTLFTVQFYCSLGFAVALLILFVPAISKLNWEKSKISVYLILAILLCVLINQCGLRPEMDALRPIFHSGMKDVEVLAKAKTQFGILHGVSALLYLLQTVFALILFWRLPQSEK